MNMTLAISAICINITLYSLCCCSCDLFCQISFFHKEIVYYFVVFFSLNYVGCVLNCDVAGNVLHIFSLYLQLYACFYFIIKQGKNIGVQLVFHADIIQGILASILCLQFAKKMLVSAMFTETLDILPAVGLWGIRLFCGISCILQDPTGRFAAFLT